ncbi:MAG: hypothetical protein NT096_00155 [Proteobacteria bacterium]|nr:hypothetical protein [Pseudomonadota bacterium]
MKHILVPIRVFEPGDRVVTDKGNATVIHDEMEGFECVIASALSCSLESPVIAEAVQNMTYRTGVIVELDSVKGDYVTGRDSLVLL